MSCLTMRAGPITWRLDHNLQMGQCVLGGGGSVVGVERVVDLSAELEKAHSVL